MSLVVAVSFDDRNDTNQVAPTRLMLEAEILYVEQTRHQSSAGFERIKRISAFRPIYRVPRIGAYRPSAVCGLGSGFVDRVQRRWCEIARTFLNWPSDCV